MRLTGSWYKQSHVRNNNMKKLVLILTLAAFACTPLLTTESHAATVTHSVLGKKHKKHHKKHGKKHGKKAKASS